MLDFRVSNQLEQVQLSGERKMPTKKLPQRNALSRAIEIASNPMVDKYGFMRESPRDGTTSSGEQASERREGARGHERRLDRAS